MIDRTPLRHTQDDAPAMSGDDLRRMRARLGMTQARLAGVLGVHPVTVARWEAGRWPVPRWVGYVRALLEERAPGMAAEEAH